MVKAVIFDLDGVISDTDRTRFELFKILLNKRGLSLEDNDYKKSVGVRTRKFLAEMFPSDLSEAEIEKIYYERKEELHQNPKKYVIAQPFVRECCESLQKKGCVLAVASVATKNTIELVLDQIGVSECFSYIIDSDDLTHMKPHPEIYLQAINKLEIPREECIAIEDSPTGVKSAKSAGIVCVAVAYTHTRDELREADYVIDSLEEINEEFFIQLDS